VPVIPALAKSLDHFSLLQANPSDGPIFRTSTGSALRLNNPFAVANPFRSRCKTCGESEHEDEDHKYLKDESRPKWQGARFQAQACNEPSRYRRR
jgi:hypothetical protein